MATAGCSVRTGSWMTSTPCRSRLADTQGGWSSPTTPEGDMERVRRMAVQAKELAVRLGLLDPEMMGLALEGLALVGQGEVSDGMRRLTRQPLRPSPGRCRTFRRSLQPCASWSSLVSGCGTSTGPPSGATTLWSSVAATTCGRTWPSAAATTPPCSPRGGDGTGGGPARAGRGRAALQDCLVSVHRGTAWRAAALSGSARRGGGELRTGPPPSHRHARQGQGGPGPGKPEMALDLVERMLRRLSERDRVERIAALELLVEVRCARGEVGDAEEALQELGAIAGIVRTDCLLALVSHARGRVALVSGDAAQAKAHLEDALDLYERNRLPFDAALARLDLARACTPWAAETPPWPRPERHVTFCGAWEPRRGPPWPTSSPGRLALRSSAHAKRRCSSC